MAGGPVPPNGLVLGRGSALFRVENIGGNRVRRMRPDLDDPASASEVHLYRSYSIAPFLLLRGGCGLLHVLSGVLLRMVSLWLGRWSWAINGLALLGMAPLGFWIGNICLVAL